MHVKSLTTVPGIRKYTKMTAIKAIFIIFLIYQNIGHSQLITKSQFINKCLKLKKVFRIFGSYNLDMKYNETKVQTIINCLF